MKVAIALFVALFMPFVFTKERQGKGHGHPGLLLHRAPVVVPHPVPVAAYHPKPAPPKCHIVHETRYQTKCKKLVRPAINGCVEYRKEYQTKCYIAPQTCHPHVVTVPDDACHNENEKHCTVEVKTTYDVSYQDQCDDIEHKVCEHATVIGAYKRPAVVGHPVVGHVAHSPIHGGHFHKREAKSGLEKDDRKGKSLVPYPAVPLAPKCHAKIERVCKKVPVKVPHHVEIPHCTKISHLKCIPSFRTIQDSVCHDEPREVCREVEIEVPYDVPVEYCPPVTKEVCHKVPHPYTKEVCHGPEPHY